MFTEPDGAIVIFVKTPGLSPLKTRLAASSNSYVASQFYDLSIAATSALAKAAKNILPDLQIYWAVAEPEGLDAKIWSEFPTLAQGSGTLGDRLSHIYDLALRKHKYVCFFGSDSPHIMVSELVLAIKATKNQLGKNFVLGETDDGGFYFFGGGTPVAKKYWTDVEYSLTTTARHFKESLGHIQDFTLVSKNFDIDVYDDLKQYQALDLSKYQLLPEQIKLISWANELTK